MENELNELQKLLKEALPPAHNEELRRDLWPALLQHMNARHPRANWLDWILLAGLGLSACFFPSVVLALLYHI